MEIFISEMMITNFNKSNYDFKYNDQEICSEGKWYTQIPNNYINKLTTFFSDNGIGYCVEAIDFLMDLEISPDYVSGIINRFKIQHLCNKLHKVTVESMMLEYYYIKNVLYK